MVCAVLALATAYPTSVCKGPEPKGAARWATRVLQWSGELYRVDHPEHCPTLDDLIAAGILDAATVRLDPWGQDFRITCTHDVVEVTSAGPDRTFDTPDDVIPQDASTPSATQVADERDLAGGYPSTSGLPTERQD